MMDAKGILNIQAYSSTNTMQNRNLARFTEDCITKNRQISLISITLLDLEHQNFISLI